MCSGESDLIDLADKDRSPRVGTWPSKRPQTRVHLQLLTWASADSFYRGASVGVAGGGGVGGFVFGRGASGGRAHVSKDK